MEKIPENSKWDKIDHVVNNLFYFTYRPKYTLRFLICLKTIINSQIFRSNSSCKIYFIQCLWCWLNLLQWMLFIPCNNWKTSLSIKFYCYLVLFQPPCCCFLVLKRLCILHATSTITVQYLCEIFKIQPCNGAVLYFFNFLN